MMDRLTTLSSFLAGYLHQDWDLEYENVSAATADFASKESVQVVLGVLGELAMVNAASFDEPAVEAVLRDAGCYYRPTETSAKSWLVDLEREIGSALWTRLS
jgi:hypothetical protein